MSMKEPACQAHLNADGSSCSTIHEVIARLAYSIYVRRGSHDGEEVRNWLDAEAQVGAKHASTTYMRSRILR